MEMFLWWTDSYRSEISDFLEKDQSPQFNFTEAMSFCEYKVSEYSHFEQGVNIPESGSKINL